MLRITHVARRFHPLIGGTERYVLDLARRQAADGHRVTVVTLDRDVMGAGASRLPPRDDRDGVRVVRLPGLGGRRWAMTLRPDRLVAELRRADVVHAHDLRFQAGLAHLVAAARRRPLLLHTHGLFFHTDEHARLKALALRGYYGPLLRLAGSVVVAGSAADRDRLIRAVPSLGPATHVVLNAVELAELRRLPREPVPGRLLSLGRVTRSKGRLELLAGLAHLAATEPGRTWQLVIAGEEEPDEVTAIRHAAAEMGIADRLTLRGPVDDSTAHELLSTTSVALFPSRSEGFGLALLEAMAAGVPSLASDIPAHREVVGPELTDRLVDFRDARAVGAAVGRLLDDDGERRLVAALARQRSLAFDMEQVWGEIRELYRRAGLVAR